MADLKAAIKPVRRGQLTVIVRKAEGLPAADSNGLSDPYVICQVLDNKGHPVASQKTKTVKKSLSPEWNEEVKFFLGGDGYTLKFIVMDWDMLSADDFLGSSSPFGVEDFASDTKHESKLDLYAVDGKPAGTLFVHFEFQVRPMKFFDRIRKKQAGKYVFVLDTTPSQCGSIMDNMRDLIKTAVGKHPDAEYEIVFVTEWVKKTSVASVADVENAVKEHRASGYGVSVYLNKALPDIVKESLDKKKQPTNVLFLLGETPVDNGALKAAIAKIKGPEVMCFDFLQVDTTEAATSFHEVKLWDLIGAKPYASPLVDCVNWSQYRHLKNNWMSFYKRELGVAE